MSKRWVRFRGASTSRFRLASRPTHFLVSPIANLHLVASLLHMTKPCEWNDSSARQDAVFENPPKPAGGLFHLPTGPGLGLQINEAELAKRRVPIA
jgi:L-alanine-DL-glutamate epimerase-like enolase superfamily enzyme